MFPINSRCMAESTFCLTSKSLTNGWLCGLFCKLGTKPETPWVGVLGREPVSCPRGQDRIYLRDSLPCTYPAPTLEGSGVSGGLLQGKFRVTPPRQLTLYLPCRERRLVEGL